MLKCLCLAFAGLFALATVAQGAGTVPGFSLYPQFDLSGKIAPGCRLYVIQAGTTSTPQNAYQDSGLSILQPNPLTCDAAGRLPLFFVADGVIKVRLTDKNGVQIFAGDNLPVIGPSGGGGGGGTVDPTTVLATGDFKLVYNTGVLAGFVRCNGRTIGSATSGATERANADTSALFSFLWNADANLAVSGGRGASAAADFSANKTLALPDCRGRVIAGLDDMGNSAAGRLTATYFGSAATTLGIAGGSQNHTLTAAELPTVTGTVAGTTSAGGSNSFVLTTGTVNNRNDSQTPGGTVLPNNTGSYLSSATASLSGTFTSTNTGGGAHSVVPPTILMTTYIKL